MSRFRIRVHHTPQRYKVKMFKPGYWEPDGEPYDTWIASKLVNGLRTWGRVPSADHEDVHVFTREADSWGILAGYNLMGNNRQVSFHREEVNEPA